LELALRASVVTWWRIAQDRKNRIMHAEIEVVVDAVRQSLERLRRHL
jgi:hypothetical protein